MKITFKITDQELFNSKVEDVDTTGLKGGTTRAFGFKAEGDISIELETGQVIEATGEFGQNDYNEELGFQLVENED